MQSQRVLVTGGAGFIGSHVVDSFVAAGHQVEIIDDLSSGSRSNTPASVTLHECDVRSTHAASIVEHGRFDVCCHLAAQMDVRVSVADPVEDASRNILGTLNLLEAVRRAPRPPRFIFSSTGGAVYGDLATPPCSEADAKNPDSPYGIAKLSIEYYLAYYARVHGVVTVCLRYANVYGPRQNSHGEAGVVAMFARRLMDDRPLRVFGSGEQTRDYVYVGDVARANILAAVADLPAGGPLDTRAFNIGTGTPTSVLTLAATMQGVAGSTHAIEFAPARPGEQQRSFVSIGRAREALGWIPTLTLDAGIADAISFGRTYIANPDLAERLRTDAELNVWDSKTFYTQGAEGYTDYPEMAEQATA